MPLTHLVGQTLYVLSGSPIKSNGDQGKGEGFTQIYGWLQCWKWCNPLGSITSQESPARVVGASRNILIRAKQRMTDIRSQVAVIILLIPAMHDMQNDKASSSGKYEPSECQGFDSQENAADLGKCQRVNTFKGYASSVTCMLADAKKRVTSADTGPLAKRTELQKSHQTHTQTHRHSHRHTHWIFKIFICLHTIIIQAENFFKFLCYFSLQNSI